MTNENLWILTEERPKNSVVKTILEEYCREHNAKIIFTGNLLIKPVVVDDKFSFDYIVENVYIAGIGSIAIKVVSGKTSFVDYILIKQKDVPISGSLDNIVMIVEETKTSDAESRNTGIGQRAIKFIFADHFCPGVPKYMMYNEDTTAQKEKLSGTNVIGTKMLLAQGVRFLNKNVDGVNVFSSIKELIAAKTAMRKPPKNNVPIILTQEESRITISGRLSKPANAGNINHDPNIGTLSCYAATLRQLGWDKDIVVTQHGVTQAYVSKNKSNKFLSICKLLNVKLDGITLPNDIEMPNIYWHYSNTSEKVASILLHLTAQYSGIHGIYENHAGCERSYYRKSDGSLVALHKRDDLDENIRLPDLVLRNDQAKEIYLIEGKLATKHKQGLEELECFDLIENLYIKNDYRQFAITRWITLFGGKTPEIKEKVMLSVALDGSIALAENAPEAIILAFRAIGFDV